MIWGPGTFMDRMGPTLAPQLMGTASRRRLARGETLFLEGEVANRVAVVVTGRLKAVTVSTSGQEAVLTVSGPGELVGEISVFDAAPRTATVSAFEAAQVAVVSRRDFEQFLTDNPRAALLLIEQLCLRLRASNETRTDLSSEPVAVRLARRLVSLAEEHGTRLDGSSIDIGFPVSQVELGAWIGASREAVARELGALRSAGVLRTERRHIIIDDMEGLARRAR